MSKYNTEEQATENLATTTAWTGKADYAERRAEKAERYAERAEKARATADRLQKPINDMHGDIAFFTQPNINTSTGRKFTRQREKMFASYEKGFEERAKAAYYDEKSENLSKEPTAISSDDPEALRKLKDKLEKLTAEHEQHLAHNKALNKAIKDGTATRNSMGYYELNGKMSYFTTNETAEIRRLKDRISELESLEIPEDYEFDGGTVVFNTAENRVQILFDEIPDSETRGNLKRNGFKWSPRQKAWQRMLNTTGIRTAKRLYPRPIEEPAPAEENSYEEIKIMNDNNTNTKYNTELTENPEPTAEEFITEIFANLKEGAGIETHHFWELAEKAGFEKGGAVSNTLSKLTYVDDIHYDGKYSYSVFRLKTPPTAEEEENFLKADATDFLIHCNYAWDEIEDFSYDFYDGKYESIEKAAKSANGFRGKEFIIYNGKISGKTYYADSKKDIKELSANKTESGIQISFGNVSKLVTFKEIEEKLVDIIRTEYPPEELKTEKPEPTAEPVQENSQAEMERITAERNRYLEYMQNLYAEKGNSVPPEKWNEMWGKIGEYNSKLAEIESRIPLAYTGETEKITVDDVEIKTEKTPEIALEYNGNSEQIKALKDYVLSLGATVSSTENHLTIDTYENHRPEIESVATELGLKTDEEMHKVFNAVQGKINEVGTIEQKNIIYKIPWGIYRRYSAEDITNVVLARTNDILAIKTENRFKAVSALIADNMEKSGMAAEQKAQAEIAMKRIDSPDKLNDYVCSTEENSADNSTANSNKATAERKIRPPPLLKDFLKIQKEKR